MTDPMQTEREALLPCPCCGASAYVAREHDPDDIAWAYVRCRGCGLRTRGKWYSAGNDCPQLYAEVRDEWNNRAESSALTLAKARIAELEGEKAALLPVVRRFVHIAQVSDSTLEFSLMADDLIDAARAALKEKGE
jgi:hypothetical protein